MLHGAVTTLTPHIAALPHGGIAAARTHIETAVGADTYQAWYAEGAVLDLDDAMQLAQQAVDRLASGETPHET